MKKLLFSVLLCSMVTPAMAEITLTIPVSRVAQVVSGSPPLNDQWTANVDVQLIASAVSNSGPGLYVVLGYSINCDGSTRTYGRGSGSTSAASSHSIDVSGTKFIAEWDKWTESQTICQMQYNAEALGTALAESWGVTGSYHNIGISWSNTSNQKACHKVGNDDFIFTMSKEIVQPDSICRL